MLGRLHPGLPEGSVGSGGKYRETSKALRAYRALLKYHLLSAERSAVRGSQLTEEPRILTD